MNITIPSAKEIQAALAPLTHRERQQLSVLSDISEVQIRSIQAGRVKNPGIETCRALCIHLPALLRSRARRTAAYGG